MQHHQQYQHHQLQLQSYHKTQQNPQQHPQPQHQVHIHNQEQPLKQPPLTTNRNEQLPLQTEYIENGDPQRNVPHNYITIPGPATTTIPQPEDVYYLQNHLHYHQQLIPQQLIPPTSASTSAQYQPVYTYDRNITPLSVSAAPVASATSASISTSSIHPQPFLHSMPPNYPQLYNSENINPQRGQSHPQQHHQQQLQKQLHPNFPIYSNLSSETSRLAQLNPGNHGYYNPQHQNISTQHPQHPQHPQRSQHSQPSQYLHQSHQSHPSHQSQHILTQSFPSPPYLNAQNNETSKTLPLSPLKKQSSSIVGLNTSTESINYREMSSDISNSDSKESDVYSVDVPTVSNLDNVLQKESRKLAHSPPFKPVIELHHYLSFLKDIDTNLTQHLKYHPQLHPQPHLQSHAYTNPGVSGILLYEDTIPFEYSNEKEINASSLDTVLSSKFMPNISSPEMKKVSLVCKVFKTSSNSHSEASILTIPRYIAGIILDKISKRETNKSIRNKIKKSNLHPRDNAYSHKTQKRKIQKSPHISKNITTTTKSTRNTSDTLNTSTHFNTNNNFTNKPITHLKSSTWKNIYKLYIMSCFDMIYFANVDISKNVHDTTSSIFANSSSTSTSTPVSAPSLMMYNPSYLLPHDQHASCLEYLLPYYKSTKSKLYSSFIHSLLQIYEGNQNAFVQEYHEYFTQNKKTRLKSWNSTKNQKSNSIDTTGTAGTPITTDMPSTTDGSVEQAKTQTHELDIHNQLLDETGDHHQLSLSNRIKSTDTIHKINATSTTMTLNTANTTNTTNTITPSNISTAIDLMSLSSFLSTTNISSMSDMSNISTIGTESGIYSEMLSESPVDQSHRPNTQRSTLDATNMLGNDNNNNNNNKNKINNSITTTSSLPYSSYSSYRSFQNLIRRHLRTVFRSSSLLRSNSRYNRKLHGNSSISSSSSSNQDREIGFGQHDILASYPNSYSEMYKYVLNEVYKTNQVGELLSFGGKNENSGPKHNSENFYFGGNSNILTPSMISTTIKENLTVDSLNDNSRNSFSNSLKNKLKSPTRDTSQEIKLSSDVVNVSLFDKFVDMKDKDQYLGNSVYFNHFGVLSQDPKALSAITPSIPTPLLTSPLNASNFEGNIDDTIDMLIQKLQRNPKYQLHSSSDALVIQIYHPTDYTTFQSCYISFAEFENLVKLQDLTIQWSDFATYIIQLFLKNKHAKERKNDNPGDETNCDNTDYLTDSDEDDEGGEDDDGDDDEDVEDLEDDEDDEDSEYNKDNKDNKDNEDLIPFVDRSGMSTPTTTTTTTTTATTTTTTTTVSTAGLTNQSIVPVSDTSTVIIPPSTTPWLEQLVNYSDIVSKIEHQFHQTSHALSNQTIHSANSNTNENIDSTRRDILTNLNSTTNVNMTINTTTTTTAVLSKVPISRSVHPNTSDIKNLSGFSCTLSTACASCTSSCCTTSTHLSSPSHFPFTLNLTFYTVDKYRKTNVLSLPFISPTCSDMQSHFQSQIQTYQSNSMILQSKTILQSNYISMQKYIIQVLTYWNRKLRSSEHEHLQTMCNAFNTYCDELENQYLHTLQVQQVEMEGLTTSLIADRGEIKSLHEEIIRLQATVEEYNENNRELMIEKNKEITLRKQYQEENEKKIAEISQLQTNITSTSTQFSKNEGELHDKMQQLLQQYHLLQLQHVELESRNRSLLIDYQEISNKYDYSSEKYSKNLKDLETLSQEQHRKERTQFQKKWNELKQKVTEAYDQKKATIRQLQQEKKELESRNKKYEQEMQSLQNKHDTMLKLYQREVEERVLLQDQYNQLMKWVMTDMKSRKQHPQLPPLQLQSSHESLIQAQSIAQANVQAELERQMQAHPHPQPYLLSQPQSVSYNMHLSPHESESADTSDSFNFSQLISPNASFSMHNHPHPSNMTTNNGDEAENKPASTSLSYDLPSFFSHDSFLPQIDTSSITENTTTTETVSLSSVIDSANTTDTSDKYSEPSPTNPIREHYDTHGKIHRNDSIKVVGTSKKFSQQTQNQPQTRTHISDNVTFIPTLVSDMNTFQQEHDRLSVEIAKLLRLPNNRDRNRSTDATDVTDATDEATWGNMDTSTSSLYSNTIDDGNLNIHKDNTSKTSLINSSQPSRHSQNIIQNYQSQLSSENHTKIPQNHHLNDIDSGSNIDLSATVSSNSNQRSDLTLSGFRKQISPSTNAIPFPAEQSRSRSRSRSRSGSDSESKTLPQGSSRLILDSKARSRSRSQSRSQSESQSISRVQPQPQPFRIKSSQSGSLRSLDSTGLEEFISDDDSVLNEVCFQGMLSMNKSMKNRPKRS